MTAPLSKVQRLAAIRAAAYRVQRLRDDLTAAGLGVIWLNGTTPILSDGRGTPSEVLAAQYPKFMARLGELES